MGIKNDWLLDQIENMTLVISKLFFKKSTTKYEIENVKNLSGDDILFKEINYLLDEGKICEAEDLLYKNLDISNINILEIGIDFYGSLNLLSDEELERCNFSREEIKDGLVDLVKKYNINIDQFININ